MVDSGASFGDYVVLFVLRAGRWVGRGEAREGRGVSQKKGHHPDDEKHQCQLYV